MKQWDVGINYGIKTGANDVFIVDDKFKKEICSKEPASMPIFKKVYRGSDMKRYITEQLSHWIIYLPWHFPLQDNPTINGASKKSESEFKIKYPLLFSYLSTKKKRLMERNKDETGIRYEWYALQRCGAKYYEDFAKEKVLWMNMNRQWKFAFGEKNAIVEASLNFIASNE